MNVSVVAAAVAEVATGVAVALAVAVAAAAAAASVAASVVKDRPVSMAGDAGCVVRSAVRVGGIGRVVGEAPVTAAVGWWGGFSAIWG